MLKEFGNIKQSTVAAVFDTALDNPHSSRADIADELGISVMTVGKVVDALVSLGVLRQALSLSPQPGRRSRTLSPTPKKWIAVYELSNKHKYSFLMVDLALRIIDSFEFNVRNTVFTDDELCVFAKSCVAFAELHNKQTECIGCGVLLPYNISDYLTNTTVSILTANGFNTPVRTGQSRIYTAARLKASLKPEQSMLVLFVDKGDVKSTLLCNGACGKIKLSDTGAFHISDSGHSISALTADASHFEKLIDCIAQLIFANVCGSSPDTVVICGDLYKDMHPFCDIIGDRLFSKCTECGIMMPEVISASGFVGSAFGISGEIRHEWFLREMINNY